MGSLIFICFFLSAASSCLCIQLDTRTTSVFSVTSYGAVGDGVTDDSQAFLKTWGAVCGAAQGSPTLDVPPRKTFMLNPLSLVGPCKSNSVNVQIRGKIVAPKSRWSATHDVDAWIQFSDINNLNINGGGQIDGQGSLWWGSCSKTMDIDAILDGGSTCKDRPTALHFHNCDGLQLSSLTHLNSQRNHISINNCNGAKISKLKIVAPDDSPNTDGIDISESTNIIIENSVIGTGDDCVAINGGSSFINISDVTCGPGHGISVGSLGANGAHDTVEEVHVKNCTFKGTQNGVRIKTWQGGSGYARKITFEKINLVASRNPIIINQFYVNKAAAMQQASEIQVSDITYSQVFGTSADDVAIDLNCSKVVGCRNIVMDQVNITSATSGMKISSVCNNAHGTFAAVIPSVPCLSSP